MKRLSNIADCRPAGGGKEQEPGHEPGKDRSKHRGVLMHAFVHIVFVVTREVGDAGRWLVASERSVASVIVAVNASSHFLVWWARA
ncbi:hypothetical protein [Salinibacterium sp. ZJ454]|uniref:hypothetical protein n=1 Tax=Salinibacterium sp. ZJ454 TaxID=2708339 RepID=UPI0014218C1D|nr:hypothetical protein [Salinibacterium sp. ZJ454]